MTTPERGRDGLREAVLTRGERETLESYLVALWQCKTERGYNEFVSRVLDYAAQIKTAGALIAVDDILAEHPATGDEAAGIRGVLHHIQRLDENGVRRDFTPPASDVDSDNAAAGGAEGLADSVYRTGLVNLPLADSLDVDCHDVARAVLASDWLAAHDAKARADERERIAQAIQRAKPPHLTRDYTPVDAAYDTAARIARGES